MFIVSKKTVAVVAAGPQWFTAQCRKDSVN